MSTSLVEIISIHALREEGDRSVWAALKHQIIFLSTPSARRATVSLSNRCPTWEISIHALREEGDFSRQKPGVPP